MGYICKYRSSDVDLQEAVHRYCEIYNDRIDFTQYYHNIWKEPLPGHGKTKCLLHDEKVGESFSYKKDAKFWSCWGACSMNAAGVVEYHMMYLRKSNPNVNLLTALRDLHRLYPFLPAFQTNVGRKGQEPLQGLSALVAQVERANCCSDTQIQLKDTKGLGRNNHDFSFDVYKIFLGDADLVERRYVGATIGGDTPNDD